MVHQSPLAEFRQALAIARQNGAAQRVTMSTDVFGQ
jgi:hypothetical protein